MQHETPTQSIIAKWPSKRALAADVSSHTGSELQPVAVIRWYRRSSIPAKYDAAIIAAATKRAISVSLVDLMDARSFHTDQAGNSASGVQGQDAEKTQGAA